MRRVWIIAKKDKVEQSDINDAKAHDCPEIANGIPPALHYIVHDSDLPCAYEEPQPPVPPEPRDYGAELAKLNVTVFGTKDNPPRSTHISTIEAIDPSKARPVKIKRVWEGRDYFYDCLMPELVREQHAGGKIKVGDRVFVIFEESGVPVIVGKM